MFFQHFIECLFHFNNYEKHEKYNRFPQSERSVTPSGELGRGGDGGLFVVIGAWPQPRSSLRGPDFSWQAM